LLGRSDRAVRHIAALDEKLAQLQAIRGTLSRLVDACHGDARAECPILEGLAGTPH